MPVIARFCGVVIRLLVLQPMGTRIHAFHGDGELVVDLKTLRVIQGALPGSLGELVMDWVRNHQLELLHWHAA